MVRLGATDVRAVLDFLGTAVAGTASQPLQVPTLVALRNLLGADEAEYFELRRADRSTIALAETNYCEPVPGTDEALLVYGAQNPLAFRTWTPADGALRQSACIRHADLVRLPYHGEILAPNRITDAMKVWLWSSAESVACVQLWRHGGQFSRRDQDVLGVLQHDLIRLRRQALDGQRWPAFPAGELTAREAEVLLWAIRGYSHADIGSRLGVSPATVGKHLEHAYEKLDVRSRAEAVDRLLLSGPLD